jgi:hypothetical protein
VNQTIRPNLAKAYKFKSEQQNYVHADEFFLELGKKQKAKHCYTRQ